MYPSYCKRWIDLSLSILSLFLLSWLFALIMIAFLLTNNFPFFFKQERIGFNNVSFIMWKFRTLSQDLTLPLVQRTFPLGQWLRKTSLDELPQLWNVLKGDMSLVGPRPLPKNYLPRFTKEQLIRHNVKPGITGLAQVSGKNLLKWSDKFRYDCFYVENVSLGLDLSILLKTAKLIFSPNKDYSLAEQEFNGNN